MDFVYLDVSVGDKPYGRLVFELFTKDAPLASNNFKTLCENKSYAHTYFHRIIKTFIIQGGDIDIKTNNSASTYPEIENLGIDANGKSIYEEGYFKDENLIDLDKSFLLCMSNFNQKDHNKCQFFITLEKSPHLNGKHTVFGRVVYGKSIIRELEKVDVVSNKSGEKLSWMPKNPVTIDDCGIWKDSDPIPNSFACLDQIGGDIYEEYPDDNEIEGLDLENSEQSYRITSTIKESATLIFKQKRLNDAFLKYKKALRYCNELIPDENSNKEMFKKFQSLKMTLFLNLSLVALNMNDYESCITYCGFVLQMEDVELTNIQASKVFYRLGKSYFALKKYDVAYETLQKGALVNPNDVPIKKELEMVGKIINKSKEDERKKYAKFFS